MAPLEQLFRGERAWLTFADAARRDQPPPPEPLIRILGGDEVLAAVAQAVVGPDALAWATRTIPALDDMTPAECVQNGQAERLKTMLMRM